MKYGQNIVIAPKREINPGKFEEISLTLNEDKALNFTSGKFKINILVLKGQNAVLELDYTGEGDVLEEMHITLEEGSELIVKSNVHKPSGILVLQRNIKQEGNLTWKEKIQGCEYVKNSVEATLLGGEFNALITYDAKNESQYDIYTKAVHVKKSTSHMQTKGIVDDFAKGLSRGLIKIEEDAAGSLGYEKMDTLILGGEADAIPDLEIHNHDVSCSHGATISKLDEEMIFYLQSRGISLKEAKEMLIAGFLGGENA